MACIIRERRVERRVGVITKTAMRHKGCERKVGFIERKVGFIENTAMRHRRGG